MSEITAEQLKLWERLANAATWGSCVVPEYDKAKIPVSLMVQIERLPDWKTIQFTPFTVGYEADALFYAASRTVMPALLAEVERLRGENERLALSHNELLAEIAADEDVHASVIAALAQAAERFNRLADALKDQKKPLMADVVRDWALEAKQARAGEGTKE